MALTGGRCGLGSACPSRESAGEGPAGRWLSSCCRYQGRCCGSRWVNAIPMASTGSCDNDIRRTAGQKLPGTARSPFGRRSTPSRAGMLQQCRTVADWTAAAGGVGTNPATSRVRVGSVIPVPSTVLAESGLSECHLSPDCVESFNQFFVDVAVGIVVISACSSWERSSRSRHRVA